jgi:hypothetical protein
MTNCEYVWILHKIIHMKNTTCIIPTTGMWVASSRYNAPNPGLLFKK